jgi:hypothetical protein
LCATQAAAYAQAIEEICGPEEQVAKTVVVRLDKKKKGDCSRPCISSHSDRHKLCTTGNRYTLAGFISRAGWEEREVANWRETFGKSHNLFRFISGPLRIWVALMRCMCACTSFATGVFHALLVTHSALLRGDARPLFL